MPHAKLNGGSTDAELMMRVQADDPEAFELLFDRHWGRSFAVARIVCHDTGQAEEAVQDAFLSMWRSRATYRTEVGTFKAWSTWVVRNRAIDLLRRNHTRREDPGLGGRGEFPSDAAGPEAAAEARGVQTDLWASLKQLPAAQAEVIAMAFYGDLTHKEIASKLALPAATVKGRMRLGLDKLRVAMEPAQAGSPAGD